MRPSLDVLTAEGKRLAEEIEASFPDNAKALALSGRLSYELGDSTAGLARWERAVELDPKCADAWLGMAELAREQGDLERAVAHMGRLASSDPALARETVFVLVDSLQKLSRAAESIKILEEIGQSETLPPWAQIMLGQGYYQLGEYERSAAQYEVVLEADPDATTAHYGMSLAMARMGRHEDAAKHRAEYAALEAKELDAFDRMSRDGTYVKRNYGPEARSLLVARYHFEAGRLYADRRQRGQAERHLRRAWALSPGRPEIRDALQSLYP